MKFKFAQSFIKRRRKKGGYRDRKRKGQGERTRLGCRHERIEKVPNFQADTDKKGTEARRRLENKIQERSTKGNLKNGGNSTRKRKAKSLGGLADEETGKKHQTPRR